MAKKLNVTPETALGSLKEALEEPQLDVTGIPGTEEPVLLTAKGYSLAYVPKKGHTLFEISFNPETGAAAVTKQESFGTDRVMAKEKFKLSVIRAKIL